MPRHEYKVVPAPRKGLKAKGVKSPEDRFAHALATLMNEHARDGWQYLRIDTLPMQERKGLTGTTTTFQNMVVFQRVINDAEASLTPATVVGASTIAETGVPSADPVINDADSADMTAADEEKPSTPKLIVPSVEGAAPLVGPATKASTDADSVSDGESDPARNKTA